MLSTIKNKLNHYGICRDSKIIISISGGVDSIVLLDLMQKLNYNKLHLIHFNYKKHKKSKKASDFIKKTSLKNNYNYKVYYPKVPKNNFENLARINRYDILLKYIKDKDCKYVFTAHHYDDQIETLIMKDSQNSDWISYLGIREKYGSIFRPLLDVKKNDIYKYAYKNKLLWFEDDTNKDLKYSRNKIRNRLSENKYTAEYITSLINRHIHSKKNILEYSFLEQKYSNLIYYIENKTLFLDKRVTSYFKDEYLKLFLKKIIYLNFNLNINKTYKFWLSVYSFFEKSKLGNSIYFSNEIVMKTERSNYIIYNSKNLESFCKIKISGKTKWNNTYFLIDNKVPDRKYISVLKCPKDIIESGLYITNWIHGDYIKANDGASKKVSDIFINQKFSYYNKKNYPIIRNNKNQIIWIPNLEFEKFKSNEMRNIYWMKND